MLNSIEYLKVQLSLKKHNLTLFNKYFKPRLSSLGFFVYISYVTLIINQQQMFKNFNRHEIFTEEDMNAVSNAIDESRMLEPFNWDLNNMLCGLFDGYLYESLEDLAKRKFSETELTPLLKTINKVKEHVAINGETETRIF